jgi:hypothetical protein
LTDLWQIQLKREGEKAQVRKNKNTKMEIAVNTWKCRESSETTLRNYIPINLIILKKWTNSLILITIQN